MHAESSRFEPLYYWRTFLLVPAVGLLIVAAFQDQTAALLGTVAAAFVYYRHEHRRWIEVPAHMHLADALVRLSLAFTVTWLAGR